jgi:SET domain-containing protein
MLLFPNIISLYNEALVPSFHKPLKTRSSSTSICNFLFYAPRHREEEVGKDKEMSLRKCKKNYYFRVEHGRLRVR